MDIAVNKTTLFYEKEGSGPPMILLHGNGEDHHIFDMAVPELSKQWTVYRIDSRGHGNSSPADAFHYQEMAEDVICFIELLHIEKPILYGFSDGGILALLIASQRQELLKGIIISGANLNPKGMKTGWYYLFKFLYFFNGDAKFKMMLTEPHITKQQLKKIKIPAFVTAGQKDMIKEKHTCFLAGNIPCSRLKILPGENHSSYVNSIRLTEVIREGASFIQQNFLNGIPCWQKSGHPDPEEK